MGGLRGVAFIPQMIQEKYFEVDSQHTLDEIKSLKSDNLSLKKELLKASPQALKDELDKAKIEIQGIKSQLFSTKTNPSAELEQRIKDLLIENAKLKQENQTPKEIIKIVKSEPIEIVKTIYSEPQIITEYKEKTNMKHILLAVLISFVCSTTITYELFNYFKKEKQIETVLKKK